MCKGGYMRVLFLSMVTIMRLNLKMIMTVIIRILTLATLLTIAMMVVLAKVTLKKVVLLMMMT